jgi:large subunit ribosomal protein L9
VRIVLHSEVDTHVSVNVARSEDEAARQARGEDVTTGDIGEAAETAEESTPAEAPTADDDASADEPEETAESTGNT